MQGAFWRDMFYGSLPASPEVIDQPLYIGVSPTIRPPPFVLRPPSSAFRPPPFALRPPSDYNSNVFNL